jgi:hypothetical protein
MKFVLAQRRKEFGNRRSRETPQHSRAPAFRERTGCWWVARPVLFGYNATFEHRVLFRRGAAVIPGIDPKIDSAFKKAFGSEPWRDLTASLINAVLKPPARERLVDVELLNPCSEKMTLGMAEE